MIFSGRKTSIKAAACFVLAALFLFTGTAHFLKPDLFLKIVPPMLPFPLALVYLSGFFELAGAAGLLIPKFRKAAAYGLAALLIAVLPANIYMAMAHISFGNFMDQPLYHCIRIPFQAVLIAWVLWVS